MSSEQGATVDGDNKAVDENKVVDANAVADVEPGIDELKFSEPSQATDNLFDWIKVANHSFDSGDLENAKQCYLRALDLCDQDDDAEHTQRLVCLTRLGEICLRLKQSEQAFKIFASAKPRMPSPSASERSQKFVLNIAILMTAIVSFMSVSFPNPSIKVNETNNESVLNLSTKSSIAAAIKNRGGKKFISPIEVGAEFKTPDGMSTVKIADSSTLYRWDHGDVWEVKYFTPNFSFGDILKLTSGCRKNAEHFVIMAPDYLVDDTGLIFYGPDTPEVSLVKRMWWYPGFINYYFGKFKKYPDKEEDWMNTVEDYNYTNPFTGELEKASFVAVASAIEPPPTVAKPGAIIILSTPTGDSTICGYDRNSRLITSSVPGKPLLIQLKKGVNVTEQHLKSFGGIAKPKKTDQPELFIFINDPALKSLMESAETYVPAIAIPLWFASLTLSLFLFRLLLRSQAKILAFAPMLLPTVLVLMVLFMTYGE